MYDPAVCVVVVVVVVVVVYGSLAVVYVSFCL